MTRTAIRRRLALTGVAAALVVGIAGAATPAGAAEPIPPLGCGLVRHEVGPLSATVHRLEPVVLRLGLAYPLHDLNCRAVITLEQNLGLQTKPSGPFG
jgi:hypothetical protein